MQTAFISMVFWPGNFLYTYVCTRRLSHDKKEKNTSSEALGISNSKCGGCCSCKKPLPPDDSPNEKDRFLREHCNKNVNIAIKTKDQVTSLLSGPTTQVAEVKNVKHYEGSRFVQDIIASFQTVDHICGYDARDIEHMQSLSNYNLIDGVVSYDRLVLLFMTVGTFSIFFPLLAAFTTVCYAIVTMIKESDMKIQNSNIDSVIFFY